MNSAPDAELDRLFRPIPAADSVGDLDMRLDFLRYGNHGLTWDKLLEHRWTVVLGEAGAGKSTEFRQRASILRTRGDNAFFMDIHLLAKDGPESASEYDSSKLRAWIDGDAPAVFFLDSIDEAELRQESLGRALKKLFQFLGKATSGMRLIISCRVSDWGSRSGYNDLVQFIHNVAGDSNAPENQPQVVQLVPLDDDRIDRLVRTVCRFDPALFLQEIRSQAAYPFVGRPLDAIRLAKYWNVHGKLGTLTEIIQSDIEERLKERRPNSCPRSVLSPEKALAGLTQLAGLAILSGRWSFLVPGEDSATTAQDNSLDPQTALRDWSPHEIAELLTRGVFDPATYGRIRIHHRSVQEYLAAQWLDGLIGRGLTQRQLERLFVRELVGRRFIPAHLIPTCAWLAHSHENAGKWLIEIEPQSLFEHGDPAGIPATDRERALEAYLDLYPKRDQEQIVRAFDHVALKRFAPALEVPVSKHLKRTDLPAEAIELLLTLAAEGKFLSCREPAQTWARDARAAPQVRCEAFRAVAALDTPLDTPAEHRSLADELLARPDQWGQDEAGVFARLFFPSILSAGEMGELLRKAAPGYPNTQTVIKSFVQRDLPEVCPAGARLAMLRELSDTIRATQRDKGWLLHGLQELMSVVVERMSAGDEPADELREALQLYLAEGEQAWDLSSGPGRLRAAINTRPRVRRWLFWAAVDASRAKNGIWPETYFSVLTVVHRILEDLRPEDAAWLVEDAIGYDEQAGRQLAFGTLRILRRSSAAVAGALEHVVHASGDAEFRAPHESDTKARNTPYVPAAWELNHWQEQENDRKEIEKRQADERECLISNLEKIRSGEQRYLLSFVCQKAALKRARYGVGEKVLRERFGDAIAEAAISGLKACWRNTKPPFQFEEKTRHTASGDVILGLAGLQLEFEAGLNSHSLTADEIELAVCYAGRQLNAFPEWFHDIAQAHPQLVADILHPEITADVQLENRDDVYPSILSKLLRIPGELQGPISAMVFAELQAHTPTNERSLEDALRLCKWLQEKDHAAFSALCLRNFSLTTSVQAKALWWCALAFFAPTTAVDTLDEHTPTNTETQSYGFIEAICDKLCARAGGWSEHSAILRDVHALEQLIPRIYRAILPENDKENRSGKADFVTPRDTAQWFRYELFGHLQNIGSADSVAAFERLAALPQMQTYRDDLLRHAWTTLRHGYEASALSPSEAFHWSRTHAIPVRSAGDLHRIVLDRLDDIRQDVEGGEFSQRKLYWAEAEQAFQVYIANELKSAREIHRYQISREAEVDDNKEPDIRVSHCVCPHQPVTVEIKIAEEWSLNQLLDTLRTQIIKQYLRARESRHGILLLCSRPEAKYTNKKDNPKRKEWQIDGRLQNLAALVATLQAEALRLVAANPDVDRLDVFGIDFH